MQKMSSTLFKKVVPQNFVMHFCHNAWRFVATVLRCWTFGDLAWTSGGGVEAQGSPIEGDLTDPRVKNPSFPFISFQLKIATSVCFGWSFLLFRSLVVMISALHLRSCHRFASDFSRKTFRRRVLQKIVGVSHTTHIPHISSTFYISHTYPFQTYPPHISHTYPAHCTYPTHIHSKRIPHIRIPSVRIHAMRIHSKGCNTYPTNHHQYPIHIQHIIHIPHISISNVSIPNVSHQYVSIANVSIQKVCISRNRKRIPPIHIPLIRIFNTYPTSTDPFNAYPFKKFASAGMALSMSITAYHFIPFIPLLLGGNGNEYKNLAFPSILCKIINWI